MPFSQNRHNSLPGSLDIHKKCYYQRVSCLLYYGWGLKTIDLKDKSPKIYTIRPKNVLLPVHNEKEII